MDSTAYDVFDAIRNRTWECLAEETVPHLATFWSTYRWASRRNGRDLSMGSPDFGHFSLWLAARRGEGLHTGGWQQLLAAERGGKEGVEAFFVELDAFRKVRLIAAIR
jgi:hypothetical protein